MLDFRSLPPSIFLGANADISIAGSAIYHTLYKVPVRNIPRGTSGGPLSRKCPGVQSSRLHIFLEMIPMPTTTLLNLSSICLLTPPTVGRLLPRTIWYSRVSLPKNLTRFKAETASV